MSREEVIEKTILERARRKKSLYQWRRLLKSILFLCDSAASATITGIAMPLDAGWTAH